MPVSGKASGARGRVAALCACLALSACSGLRAEEPLAPDEVDGFVEEVSARHGMDPAEVAALLSEARVLPRILEAMSRPAESKPWHAYRPIFVTDARTRAGVAFWHAHAETIARAAERFGVAPEVIVAIIGVETRYGSHTGGFRVLDALATLGFRYPRRAAFFRSELEQFLVLAREEALDPRTVKGSYAGAMGMPQFIASSYRHYAVDFDGDGRKDLLGSADDAIGSVASYLARHGWERGAPVAVRARAESTPDAELLDGALEPRWRAADLRARGLEPVVPVSAERVAALVALDGEAGTEYWLGFRNFYAITRYNRSPLYAMAVHQLSEAIRAAYGPDGAA